MKNLKIFIIHVDGATERYNHIKNELKKFNFDAEFVLDGNKEAINEERLNKYFINIMHSVTGQTSCALKHILAYEKAIEQSAQQILILEDDIILKPNFKEIIRLIFNEIEKRKLSNYLISLENTNHNYIQKSEVINNQILYKKEKSRCAGAYLIDINCATSIVSDIYANKCGEPIDWFHNTMSKDNKINVYWSYPHIAEQASHNGRMASLIDVKKVGLFRRVIYFFQGEIKKRWAPLKP